MSKPFYRRVTRGSGEEGATIKGRYILGTCHKNNEELDAKVNIYIRRSNNGTPLV